MCTLQARLLRLNKSGHFLAYEANSWPGDSGAALLMYDGKVLGMHQHGVGALVDRLTKKEIVDGLDSLGDSMLRIARSVGQGGIGLLSKYFPKGR